MQDNDLEPLGGKFLTFHLADEEYGVPILVVREIIGMMPVTPVPHTPAYVLGVINLRGRVIPVVDLRARFEMPLQEPTPETVIIIVEVERAGTKETTGIVVDRVAEVSDIADDDIADTPPMGPEVDARPILGMGKADGKVVILLDVARTLEGADLGAVAADAAAAG